jgi:hypothetical protein
MVKKSDAQGATLTDDEIDSLWLYRSNVHNGELMPQLRDFARALLAAAKPISVDEDPCDHEWRRMTEPHKECVKCGDVRRDWSVSVDKESND